MQDPHIARTDPHPDAVYEDAVEIRHPELLVRALSIAAIRVPRRELGRADLVEDLRVVGGNVRIPRPDASTRDDDEAVGIDPKRGLDPPDERHPVESLVADLRQPRPDDDRRSARDGTLDLTLDAPLLPVGAQLFLHAVRSVPPPHDRLTQTPQPARRLPEQAGSLHRRVARTVLRDLDAPAGPGKHPPLRLPRQAIEPLPGETVHRGPIPAPGRTPASRTDSSVWDESSANTSLARAR